MDIQYMYIVRTYVARLLFLNLKRQCNNLFYFKYFPNQNSRSLSFAKKLFADVFDADKGSKVVKYKLKIVKMQ